MDLGFKNEMRVGSVDHPVDVSVTASFPLCSLKTCVSFLEDLLPHLPIVEMAVFANLVPGFLRSKTLVREVERDSKKPGWGCALGRAKIHLWEMLGVQGDPLNSTPLPCLNPGTMNMKTG